MKQGKVDNPVTQIRERFGLKKEDFALLLDISPPTLQRVENGVARIPEKSYKGLRQLGLDPEKVAEDQLHFIEDKKRKILESLTLRKN
jgi:DNA-binding transcriptional regulator YiaG